MNWQDIHILGFMIFSCSLLWIVAGELITTTQNEFNIFAYIGLMQCSIGGIICFIGAVKGGGPFG